MTQGGLHIVMSFYMIVQQWRDFFFPMCTQLEGVDFFLVCQLANIAHAFATTLYMELQLTSVEKQRSQWYTLSWQVSQDVYSQSLFLDEVCDIGFQ